MRRSLWFAFLLSVACPQAMAAADDWLLQFDNRSTNDFFWDKRAQPLIRRVLPREVAKEVIENLSGPPDAVHVEHGRYFSASACMAHSCTDKGFFWMDVATGIALGAATPLPADAVPTPEYPDPITLLLGSAAGDAETIPPEARHALQRFLDRNELHPMRVTFVTGAGEHRSLDPAQFSAKPRFEPPPDGPSFDCAAATSAIERAICASPDLARKDLDLSRTYRDLLATLDRLPFERQLKALQRAWVVKRNQTCGREAQPKECLESSYRQQQDVLLHWAPQPEGVSR